MMQNCHIQQAKTPGYTLITRLKNNGLSTNQSTGYKHKIKHFSVIFLVFKCIELP